jgi:hypothetical protein
MEGKNGRDYMAGGDGNDTMKGGNGSDTMDGGDGNDEMYGDNGRDYMSGDRGRDYMSGGDGNDVMCGEQGRDTLYGGDGKDELSGGKGNDYIDGGDGNDRIQGNQGDDYLTGGYGKDDFEFLYSESKYGEYDHIKDWNAGTKYEHFYGELKNDQVDLCGNPDKYWGKYDEFRVTEIKRVDHDDVLIKFSTGAKVKIETGDHAKVSAADDFLGSNHYNPYYYGVKEGVNWDYKWNGAIDQAHGKSWTDDFSAREYYEANCVIECKDIPEEYCYDEPDCPVPPPHYNDYDHGYEDDDGHGYDDDHGYEDSSYQPTDTYIA